MASDGRGIVEGQENVPAISSVASYILDRPPSCLEFCPVLPELFVVGTYELQQSPEDAAEAVEIELPASTQKRKGSVMLFSYSNDSLTILQTIEVDYGVLDLRFKPSEPTIFALATSNGSIVVCSLNGDKDGSIKLGHAIQISTPDVLVLSFAWCPFPAFAPTIAATLSSGHVSVIDLENEDHDFDVQTQAHGKFEAWTVAWKGGEAPNTERTPVLAELYTGGDDSALCRFTKYPISCVTRAYHQANECLRDTKTHTAGVTAILPMASDRGENFVLTGSYDEWVKLLLPTKAGRSQVLAEISLGGGVWRLKLMDARQITHRGTSSFRILASCMHAGPRILEIANTEDAWSINILAKFVEHQSMNYASDSRGLMIDGQPAGYTIVSTSFYDKKLCVWQWRDQGD